MIFKFVFQSDCVDRRSFLLRVSYLEIYNETVTDLLNEKNAVKSSHFHYLVYTIMKPLIFMIPLKIELALYKIIFVLLVLGN